MADETLTSIRRVTTGNQKQLHARYTSSGTSGDIFTGITNLTFASFMTYSTPGGTVDNNVKVNLNSKTGDVDGGAPGWVHVEGITSGDKYMLFAQGR